MARINARRQVRRARRRRVNLRRVETRTRPCFVQLNRLLCDTAFYGRTYNFTFTQLNNLVRVKVLISPTLNIVRNRPFDNGPNSVLSILPTPNVAVQLNRLLCDTAFYGRKYNFTLTQLNNLVRVKVLISPTLNIVPNRPFDNGPNSVLSILPTPNVAVTPSAPAPGIQIVPNRPFLRRSFDDDAGTSTATVPVAPVADVTTAGSSDLLSDSYDDLFGNLGDIVFTPPSNDADVNDGPLRPLRGQARFNFKKAAVANIDVVEASFPPFVFPLLRNANTCRFCGAFYFNEERGGRTNDSSLCCQRGKVQLPPLEECPLLLRQLITGTDDAAKHFQEKIRFYNSALCFASTVGNYQQMGVGPQVVKVNGVVHHHMPQVIPRPNIPAKFGQLYYLDPEDCHTVRQSHSPQCRPNILRSLDYMFRLINPFPAQYRQLRTVYEQKVAISRQNNVDVPEVILAIAPNIQNRFVQAGLDPNRYNLPTCNEIAAIFVGSEPPFPVDIKLYPVGGEPQIVRDISPLVDPLSYPLLFPYGELGWSIDLRHTGPNATAVNNKVTCREFASFRIAIRDDFSLLHYSRKLYQQWLVDTWCRIEGLQLQYLREHQREIHLDSYQSLLNYVHRQAHQRGERIGKIFVLPPTFIGSPRYMEQKYLDAMAIVANYGKPDFFVTITCNPKWPEIANNLEPGQDYIHRPDLVCRVFHIKLLHLIKLIVEHYYFGRVRSVLYSVEFQKRGLPHAHILVILQDVDKISTSEQVDEFIRAEIPDVDKEPVLYDLVKKHVVHKKCGVGRPGVTCMRNNACRWNYPKDFRDTTHLSGDCTYAKYRRRNNGRTCVLGNTVYDNRDIVPYSPALLLIFQTHINIEICASITATKYLYKYIHKGHDGIVVNIQEGTRSNAGVFNWDEIEHYQECRYVTSHEACWRILGFELSFSNISVFLLQLHLPSMQNVLFNPNNVQQALNAQKDTHLLAYFKLNQVDVEARQYLYVDIVKNYTWQRSTHCWTRRKSSFNVIGRLPDISPRCGDLFYLRMLVNYVRGATSFDDFKRVHGLVHSTFREACLARQLIENDLEYDHCMEEAATKSLPYRLRQLFAHIVLWCDPENPLRLWDRFSSDMSADFLINFSLDDAKVLALDKINSIFVHHNKSVLDFGLPVSDPVLVENLKQRLNLNNLDSSILEHRRIGIRMRDALNISQRRAFDFILRLVQRYSLGDRSEKLVFVDGPAGTGKTFFYNSLLHSVKGIDCKTIAVAFTGIAAILLLDGITSHTQFGIPIPCDETSRSYLKFNDYRVQQLEQADLIVWDEASMTCRFTMECVDKLLRDVMKCPQIPFGGKVLVMGGDFRQLLPVKRRGGKQDVLNICVKSSPLFSLFTCFHFTENMRADPIEREFANDLLQIGNGQHSTIDGLPSDYLKVPQNFLIPASDLVSEIFDNDPLKCVHENRAILTPTNEDAFRFNRKILNLLNFPEKQYISIDKILNHNQNTFYVPLDIVHKQTPMGCPEHILILKKHAIVMLMRNINVSEGLCNGTRLKILDMQDHVLTTEILMGPKSGNVAFIPRIGFICERKDTGLPFEFSRFQFPLRLAYAMTINKSQGQTLDKTGVHLTIPVFAHGQLYVALSRSRRPSDIKISVLEGANQGRLNRNDGVFTKNIVYKEVL